MMEIQISSVFVPFVQSGIPGGKNIKTDPEGGLAGFAKHDNIKFLSEALLQQRKLHSAITVSYLLLPTPSKVFVLSLTFRWSSWVYGHGTCRH